MKSDNRHKNRGTEIKRGGESEAAGKKRLNVLFHGLFAFVFWDHCVEVLAPIVDDHVYKAGTWMFERRLREGCNYRLLGATDCGAMPPSTPCPTKNPTLTHFESIDRSSGKLFCSFILPFPDCHYPMRGVDADQGKPFFCGTDSTGLSTTVTTVQGFGYSYDEISKLSLADKAPWETLSWMPQVNGDGYVNLHVWAEPEFDLTKELNHIPMAFKNLTGLIQTLDLRTQNNKKIPYSNDAPPMDGVSAFELKGLFERLPPTTRVTDVFACMAMNVDNRMR
jgi:hypothetical protein